MTPPQPKSPPPPIRVAVLTVSDRSARGERADKSGPALNHLLEESLAAVVVDSAIVPDESAAIRSQILAWCDGSPAPDLIVTTGGTGLSPRDITPEAVSELLQRHHPQLLELARRRTGENFPRAYLSRGVAGTRGRTLILTLPGSPKGAVETLTALLDVLPHAIQTLRGEDSHG
ncbi:MAG: molybdopterin adenylyltransferase [Phycisphaerales bacterium]